MSRRKIVFIQPSAPSLKDAEDAALVEACAAAAGALCRKLTDADDLTAVLASPDPAEAPGAVLVAGALPQALAVARISHRIVPGACILLVADARDESRIRAEMGRVPVLGGRWAFVPPDGEAMRRALEKIMRADGQYRQVQTTIRRIAEGPPPLSRPVAGGLRRQRLSDQYLAGILTHGFDAVGCFGLEGEVLTWNRAAESLFGIMEQTVAGYTVDAMLQNGIISLPLELVREVIRGTDAQSAELQHLRPDGSRVEIEASAIPVRDEAGQRVGVALIARDITERKRIEAELRTALERAEEASQAKDRFLAVLSHELRTPLTPALALVEALGEREDLPADIRSDLQLVRRNILLEARLVDDLLDVTRIAKGKLLLNLETVEIHRTLEFARDICRGDAETRGVDITCDFQAANSLVEGDLARLQQVFWNLIQNAVKFTPSGGTVTLRTCNPEPGQIRIQVEDTGAGIAPEIISGIFAPFEQGSEHVTRRFGGLGLGLSICKTLVETHGGIIEAESDGAGRGSVFRVTLRTAGAAKAAKIILTDPGKRGGGPVKLLNILLVEDNDDTRNALRRLLLRRGHVVEAACGMTEALALASAQTFDFIISDIGLPDGSGAALMHELRRLGCAVKGIALSGFGMEKDVAASLAAGFSEHLVKPVNFQRLLDSIGRVYGE